ncbi:hypothetical protein WJX73_010462 [Symbiochloris irregularis]|uniref:HEAT repeat-containing protein 5B n=1 Tax=Symbiochloris irregularis TaxID=706552 RepID=A0AAW1NXA0_9CHLO
MDFAAFGSEPPSDGQPDSVRAALEGFLDEEDLLGFHVWVAELELLVGTTKSGRVDPVACFELLQKLLVSIDTTERQRLKEYGRRCEAALMDILLKGTAPPVRRLICASLVRLYARGDPLPMYARVAALQGFLASREVQGKGSGAIEIARLGALQCLGALCAANGRALASGMQESLNLAIKHSARTSDPSTRCAALALMVAAVEGLGTGDRSAEAIQSQALKSVLKTLKDFSDAATLTAASDVLQAIACAGGLALWANAAAGYDEVVRLCVSLLSHASLTVSDAFAAVLGATAAAARNSPALKAAAAAEKKASRKAALERVASDAFATCLIEPFVDAATAGDRHRVCTALAHAWLTYLHLVQANEHEEEGQLLDLGVKAIEMLARCTGTGSAPSGGEPDLGVGIASGEMPQPQACVLYIVRVGVVERLGEPGQRRLLERLAELAHTRAKTVVAVTALECMRVVIGTLGEVPAEALPRLQEPLHAQLVCSHACLRSQAATALAALAVAEQASAAGMLDACLTNMSTLSMQLAALLGSAPAPGQPSLFSSSAPATKMPATPRALVTQAEVEKVKPLMDGLHGNALGAAALLVSSTRMPLGIPSMLVQRAMEQAQLLTVKPNSQRASGKGCEREAGFVLLGALCTCLPTATLLERKMELLELWKVALSPEAASRLDLRQYVTNSMAEGESMLAMEVWWRTGALESLQAYMASVLPQASRSQGARLQRLLSSLLQPTLDAVIGSPALQDPIRGGRSGATAQFAAAAAMLQLRLLEAYLSMPSAAAFSAEHEALIKLCARSLRPATAAAATSSIGGQASGGGLAATSTLQGLLNRQDAALGPWVAARDPLEDALQAFSGAPGGPLQRSWQAGLIPDAHADYAHGSSQPASDTNIDTTTAQQFPQPRSLSQALLEAQVTLLGSLLAVVSQTNQQQILDLLAAAAAAPGSKASNRDAQGVRRGVVTAVCCAALAGLVVLARPQRTSSQSGRSENSDRVADKVRALAEVVLAEGSVSTSEGPDAALQRSAAEIFAFSACIGSDGFALQLVRAVCAAAAETTSLGRRATLALAAGCIYRSKGGIALQAAVGATVQTLLALGHSQPPGSSHLWYLHGLWLVANSAGLAFVPHVKGALALAMEALMWEESEVGPGVRAAVGRLANALVAVLGPDLSPGSAAYSRTKSLVRGMQGNESGLASVQGLASGNAMAAELERVLYVQMLVLFAPQAVPAAAHLPLLLVTLQAPQPFLRQAAAATLRHLAERDSAAMQGKGVEGFLLAALDRESDPTIASHLRASLRTLLAAGAPSHPAHWLATFSSVALASAPSLAAAGGSAGANRGAAGDLDQGLMAGGDDDTVGSDPRHFNALAAQADRTAQPGAWLVLQLQGLVDAGFKMATGQVEALRPLGLHLLKIVLMRFAKAEDPLMEDHLLLEQYQAQYVAALRSALAPEAPAALSSAGAALAVAFLRTGVAMEDATMLGNLMRLLCRPLVDWSLPQQEVHAEWVGMRARVAILEAHAHCALLATPAAPGSGSSVNADCCMAVQQAQAPHLRLLQSQWAALVSDHIILSTQPPQVTAAFTPRLFPAAPAHAQSAISKYLFTAWPLILAALCASLTTPAEAVAAAVAAVAAEQERRMSRSMSRSLSRALPQVAELGPLELRLVVDASHLAISRATVQLCSAGHDKPQALSRWQSLRGRLSMAGEDDLSPSLAKGGAQELAAALTGLQHLLSSRAVLEAIGIDGCGDALRLLHQVLGQVVQPCMGAPEAGAAQQAGSWLHAIVGALSGVVQAAPPHLLDDSYLQELCCQALLLGLSLAASFSSADAYLGSSADMAANRCLGDGPASMAFSAAERLLVSLESHRDHTDGDSCGPPAWILLPLWQSALNLLASCESETILTAATAFCTATLTSTARQSQAFAQETRGSAEQESSADADDPSMQLAAVVHSLVQVSSKALTKCCDGVAQKPDSKAQQGMPAAGRAAKLVILLESQSLTTAKSDRDTDEAVPARASSHAATDGSEAHQPGGSQPIIELKSEARQPSTDQDRQSGEVTQPEDSQPSAAAPPESTAEDAVGEAELSGPLVCRHWKMPPVQDLLRPAQLSSEACSSLPADDVQAASELFKLLLVALSAATSPSAPQPATSAEQAVLHLLVPLAVAAVAPEQQGTSPPQALKTLVLQLVPRLAAGPSAPAFRAALTSLKPASIQRLQAALKAGASGASQGSQGQGTRKLRQPLMPPSITLKNFAISKPPA